MKIKLLRTPRLALTLGEPCGVGPDLCVMLAQQKLPAEIVVVGCANLLKQRAQRLNLPLKLSDFDPYTLPKPSGESRLTIIDMPVHSAVIPGELSVKNSAYVLHTLQAGYQICDSGNCDAMVTLPVHKAIITASGNPFSGHTEFFAALANVKDVLMTFYTPTILLSLMTTHCPLEVVSSKITEQRLVSVIELLHNGLQQIFDRPQPKIRVLGLNPHAGENGTIGLEEQDVITPVIQQQRQQGIAIEGPVSADTAFTPERLAEVDALIAMYHDQGLAPLKALFFKQIVNITLGLPFLRTSVDHGTALDLAGTNLGSTQSLQLAIQVAADLAYTHTRTRLHFPTNVQPA